MALVHAPDSANDLTALLRAWSAGDPAAYDELTARVYSRLRAMARVRLLRERTGHTLQPTALVHETYLRLAGGTPIAWRDRVHFFGVCAELMRRILVDHARRRNADKRGGGARTVMVEDVPEAAGPDRPTTIDLLALDEALDRLKHLDARQSRIVELRFFGGLTHEQVGTVVGLAPRTVKLEWAKARTWLYRELFAS